MPAMRPIVVALSALLAGAFASGCINAEFVQTDSSFASSPAPTSPAVFLDRRPPEPYQAVGIIHIRAPDDTDLAEIMAAAVQKGQEVGCDVLVERAIHSVASAVPADLPRWSVVLEAPLRGARGSAAPTSTEPPRGANLLAAPTYAHPVVIGNAPSTRREFVCGVFASRGATNQLFQPAGGSIASIGLAGSSRTSPIRTPTDAERRATSEPPKGGGGFVFGANPPATEASCTGAKLPWRAIGDGLFSCDGVVASVGVPAQSLLRFCDGGLCAIEIVGKPDGVKKAQWQPRFASLKQALESKYGPPSYVSGREPPDCAVNVGACPASGVHAQSIGWAWPSGQQVELTVEVTATVTEERRVFSALFFVDYLQRPIPPPAAPPAPKDPKNQPPAGL